MSTIEKLAKDFFSVGAQYALSKCRRHPSTKKYVYSSRDGVDLFDLEKTSSEFLKTCEFIESLKKNNKTILFYTSMVHSADLLESKAKSISAPYVTRRWIGGILTNFSNIKKRIMRLEELRKQKESGEWNKFTKKEVIMLERDLNRLEEKFGGVSKMRALPDALFILDPSKEEIALAEAKFVNIPVIAIANTNSDLKKIDYPIIANNKSKKSIEFFLDKIVDIYKK